MQHQASALFNKIHSRTLASSNFGKDRAVTKPLIHCWWECKRVQPLWKTICWFLAKINISLPYGPATMLLEAFTQRTCKFVYTHKSAHRCFLTTLLVIVKIWNQSICPSVGEQTVEHLHTGISFITKKIMHQAMKL